MDAGGRERKRRRSRSPDNQSDGYLSGGGQLEPGGEDGLQEAEGQTKRQRCQQQDTSPAGRRGSAVTEEPDASGGLASCLEALSHQHDDQFTTVQSITQRMTHPNYESHIHSLTERQVAELSREVGGGGVMKGGVLSGPQQESVLPVTAGGGLFEGSRDEIRGLQSAIQSGQTESTIADNRDETPKWKDFDAIIEAKAPIKSRDKGSWKRFATEVLIIVHTVNDSEYWAAIHHMKPPEGESRCVIYTHGSVLGMFGGYKVALVQTKMGHGCQNEIERALQDFSNAQAIVAVGVAYASSKKCKYADVLVSTCIEEIGFKITKEDQIFTRGEKIEISQELVDTFCRRKDVWAIETNVVLTKSSSSQSRPKVQSGIILSAPWLIDNPKVKDKLLDMSPEAIGGEMEGGVLLRLQKKLCGQPQARHIGVIIIKGVADYAGGSKGKEWQLTAAMAAVGFACFQLERNGEFQLHGTGTLLRSNDITAVYRNLYSARKKWEVIGLELGMTKEDLDNIRDEFGRQGNDKCLSEMISQWLRACITHRPTWQKIVQALMAPTVGEEGLAQDIEKKYINLSDPKRAQATRTSQDPPSALSPSSSQSPIATYASYLRRSVYLAQKFPTHGKLPHSPSKKYISLASVKKVPVSKETADAFTRATIRGDIDDVAKKKEPITMEEIATVKDGVWPQCILVEGAPGIGKSTFAWKMCRKWGKGKILRDYGLVVLLSLREKKVREATCVSALFHFYNHRVQEQVVHDVEETGGKGVLLLFEGYDELPSELRTENSLFLDIIQRKELPQATVLITSRPSASGFLYEKCKDYFSQHIEILGFTSENVRSYLESTCDSDPSLLSGIQKYLQCYPHIRTMMYVPLNATIVVEVYRTSKKDKSDIPKTMTQLYDCLVRSLLRRYLNDHPVHGKQRWRIRTFKDLPPDVYKQLCELGRIAYKGIENGQQLIFDDLPENFETLGLMQCVPELYVDEGAAVSHSFLHLTVQEFMAAFHLSQLPVERQGQQFEEESPSQRMVLRFLAGLTGPACITFEDSDMEQVELIIDEIQWIFEAQSNIDILQASNITFDLSLQTMTTFDCYVLGYCISHSNCTWNIVLSHCSIGDEGVEGLVQGTLECPTQSQESISELKLSESSITSEGIGHLLKLPKHILSSLKILNVCNNDLTPEGVEGVISIFQQSTGLEALDISYSQLSLDNCVSLASAIGRNGSLTSLQICSCDVDSKGAEQLAGALCENSTLQELNVYGNPIGVTGATALAKALTINKSLMKLHIGNCNISFEGAEQLAGALCDNSTLQELDMCNNLIGVTGASALAKALTINKSLMKLNIGNCNISSEGAEQLAGALCENSTLQELVMCDNPIGVTGATALAKALTINKSLKELDTRDDSIGAEGTEKLRNSLTQNTTLEKLVLPRKYEYMTSSETYSTVTDTGRIKWMSINLRFVHCY